MARRGFDSLHLHDMIKETDIAWAAGLLEGEGYFATKAGRYAAIISCQMTDRDVVDHLHKVFSCGTIHTYTPKNIDHKQVWAWTVQGDDAASIMSLVLPYMFSRRRDKIEEALKVHFDRTISVETAKQETVLLHKEIAREYHDGQGSYRVLGTKYSLSRETIRRIVLNYPNPL